MKHEKETARPRGTDSAKLMMVIVTEALECRGTDDDPCRMQRRYWSLDGELLATADLGAKEDELGAMLDAELGEAKAKSVLEDLAAVIGKHKLVKQPQVCERLFRYMIFVTRGWNSL